MLSQKIAPTKNTDAVVAAYSSVRDRAARVPGMMLVHGTAGYGKTTSCEQLCAQYGGVSVRAQAFWSPSGMLDALCEALQVETTSRPYRTVRVISSHLKRNPQPVVIDEIDHLFSRPLLLEGLRDIHDLTGNPIVLVGMAGADRKVQRHPQLLRRITQSVELMPLDAADLRSIASVVCANTKIGDDLLKHILDNAKGSTGLAVVGLSQVDKHLSGEKVADLKLWKETGAALFLGSRVA
jgi:DNA transposition AAA+ family ATPase